MPNSQLIDYIKSKLANGVTREKIQASLLLAGWKETDVDTAFNSFEQPQVALSTKNIDSSDHRVRDVLNKRLPRIVFALYVASMIIMATTLFRSESTITSQSVSPQLVIGGVTWVLAALLGFLIVFYYIIKSIIRRNLRYFLGSIALFFVFALVGQGACMFNVMFSGVVIP